MTMGKRHRPEAVIVWRRPPAPAMPPGLNIPCKPDITERLLAGSTIMACTFMATSIDPEPAPNTGSEARKQRRRYREHRCRYRDERTATHSRHQGAGQWHHDDRASAKPRQKQTKPAVACACVFVTIT
jgi:hypothetical protein